jgi:hypothetical protein
MHVFTILIVTTTQFICRLILGVALAAVLFILCVAWLACCAVNDVFDARGTCTV